MNSFLHSTCVAVVISLQQRTWSYNYFRNAAITLHWKLFHRVQENPFSSWHTFCAFCHRMLWGKHFFFTGYGMRVTALYFVSDLESPLRAWCGTYWRITLWSPFFLMFQIILCDLNNTTQQKKKRKSGVTEPRKRESN